ncbi:MAG TPA: cytochrome c biogenesis protein CcdC [Myxococcales bacterium]|nr:cytochrome c biogenesis protein CcdC [Myxococcales bacterium]
MPIANHPVLTVLLSLLGAAAVLAWRMRESTRPVSLLKIVAPPLGMSTGLGMFVFMPAARVPVSWATAALALGALVLAIPVVRTSRLIRRGNDVIMQRSGAFLWILLGLVALRFALRAWVERHVSPMQTAGLFFLLAFGMIVRWRGQMLRDYRKLTSEPSPPAQSLAAPPS